ncbi:unnamed protein product [Ilex paraguariensis]|uniref:Uncharacterized protein n=1 Tax=Ilex paraguariensis TaxID=185542 RepID=A0ABC8SXK2_9AQUA
MEEKNRESMERNRESIEEKNKDSMENNIESMEEKNRESMKKRTRDEYDLDEDDRLYETNVDKVVEWAGVGDKHKDVKDGVGTSVEFGTGAAAATIGTNAGAGAVTVNVRRKRANQEGAGTVSMGVTIAGVMSSGVTAAGANTYGVIGPEAGATNISNKRGKLAVRRNKMNAPATTQDSHSVGRAQCVML